VTVKEGVNKSNRPINNPLLLVTEPRTIDGILNGCQASPVANVHLYALYKYVSYGSIATRPDAGEMERSRNEGFNVLS
jgi:hypothetical protein